MKKAEVLRTKSPDKAAQLWLSLSDVEHKERQTGPGDDVCLKASSGVCKCELVRGWGQEPRGSTGSQESDGRRPGFRHPGSSVTPHAKAA